MAARLLAFVAAVGMVVASLAVRARLDGGERAAGDGPELRLVCATELAAACTALSEEGVRTKVEPAGATADRLSKDGPEGPASLDGWLVASPWPDIVRGARQRAGLETSLDDGPVPARTPLVLTAWKERLDVLARRCAGGQLTWRCWGDTAGQPWATLGGPPSWAQVKPGHADVSEAGGVATLGAATAGFFGRTDLARADLEEDDAYRAWLARLERAVNFRPIGGSPLRDMLVKGPVDYELVATTEAEAGPLVASSARPDRPVVIYPSPVATVDAVLATAPGTQGDRLARLVRGEDSLDALARGGWRVPDRRPPAGVGAQPLPATANLPDAGILDTLRALSRQVAPR